MCVLYSLGAVVSVVRDREGERVGEKCHDPKVCMCN